MDRCFPENFHALVLPDHNKNLIPLPPTSGTIAASALTRGASSGGVLMAERGCGVLAVASHAAAWRLETHPPVKAGAERQTARQRVRECGPPPDPAMLGGRIADAIPGEIPGPSGPDRTVACREEAPPAHVSGVDRSAKRHRGGRLDERLLRLLEPAFTRRPPSLVSRIRAFRAPDR